MMFLLLTLALLSFTNAQLLSDLLGLDLSLVGGARSQLAGVLTADGQVVFAGGHGSALSTLSGAVDVIATVNDAVTAGQALSVSRYGLAAATAANFSIFAGGFVGAAGLTASADVDIYDAVSATWNTTTLEVARAHHCVGSTANYLYVAGGATASGVYTDSVEVFDAATGELDASLNFTLSLARAYVATATLETTVFFAGGLWSNGTAQVSAAVDVHLEGSANVTVVQLSEARQQIAAIAVADQVFFAGGASASNVASAVVDIWHSANSSFTFTTLSEARWGVKAVVVGDLILFHGGYTAVGVASAVIDVYNVVNQTWEVPQVLKRVRADFASVAVDNKVYIAGGVTGGIAALITGPGSLEVLDFTPQNTTETPTPTPTELVNLTVTVVTFDTARAQLAATVNGDGQLLIGGGASSSLVFSAVSAIDVASPGNAVDLNRILGVARLGLSAATVANVSVFAGGATLAILPSTAVDIYFAANSSWLSANLQTARVFHATAIVGTKIYFAGGRTATGFTNSIEVYDTETGRWTTLPVVLSVARGYLAASVVGNQIIFAGGKSGNLVTSTVSDDVDVLDTVSVTITSTLKLSAARAELAASVVGDLVLFGGGVEISGSASVVVDVWNSTSGVLEAASEGLSVGRWALQSVTVGTDVFFVGGFDGTDAYATVDIWSSVNGQWTTKQLTYPRYNFAATVDVDGNAYFCGGQDSLGFLASVEIYAGASSDNTPTPTPGDETPTPTPVVVPTPTPGQTPTPTPGANNCVSICQNEFSSASDSWNTGGSLTTFTVQCSVWATRLSCLDACKQAGDDTNGDHDAAVTACQQTDNVKDFCACERDNFGFNVAATLAFIDTNNGQFVTKFNTLTGVRGSPTNGNAGTVITVDQNGNSLGVTFTYEDSVIIGTVSATVELIGVEWSVQLADFFNTSPLNFATSASKKRDEQSGSLSVAVADNAGSSGVSQLSISFAFVLVTFLLHVLF